jgi:hypothetical protein
MKAVKAVKVVRPLYADFYEELYNNEVAKKKQNDHFFANFQIPKDTDSDHLDFVKSLLKGLNDSMRDYAAIFGINYSSNKSMFDTDFQTTQGHDDCRRDSCVHGLYSWISNNYLYHIILYYWWYWL